MSERPEPTAGTSVVATSWRWAVYGGAVLGGVFWGVVAAVTVGAPGDDARHAAEDGHRLLIAAVITVAALVIGGLVVGAIRSRTGEGMPRLRSIALAMMIGPLGGWIVLASLAAQGHSMGWG